MASKSCGVMGARAAYFPTLINTWISLSKLLSPAAYLDLSTTCAPHSTTTDCN